MKIIDIIRKQKEYRQIQQAKEEVDALYYEGKALIHNDETSKLEHEISDAIRACQYKLRDQLRDMEV